MAGTVIEGKRVAAEGAVVGAAAAEASTVGARTVTLVSMVKFLRLLILDTSPSVVHNTKRFIASQFDMKDMGEAKVIVGVKITTMGDSIMLSHEHYVEKILKRFGHFDTKPVSTLYDANTHLMKNRGDHVGQAEYTQIIESLMHLMNFYRPDIAYAVCRLSRYTHNPNNDHWSILARLMKYLRGTMNYGILYSGFPTVLE